MSAGSATSNSIHHESKILLKNVRKFKIAKLEFATCRALCHIHMNDMMCRNTLPYLICRYMLYANTMTFYIRDLSIWFWYPEGEGAETNLLQIPKNDYIFFHKTRFVENNYLKISVQVIGFWRKIYIKISRHLHSLNCTLVP